MSEVQVQTRNRKYLVFHLEDQPYAVPLSEVKEVIGLPECTPIPGGPGFFVGMINLRGKVVTAVDLKHRLANRPSPKTAKRPVAIIVELDGVTIGCVADSVAEVLNLEETQIERSLDLTNSRGPGVSGIARCKDRPMILVLNLAQAVRVSEFIQAKAS